MLHKRRHLRLKTSFHLTLDACYFVFKTVVVVVFVFVCLF